MPPRRCSRLSILVLLWIGVLGASAPALARADGFRPRPLPRTVALHATVALTPRHPAALAAYASAVTTPGSRLYRRYLNVAQFARRFGRSRAEIAQVTGTLAGRGLTVGSVAPNGLTLRVTSTAPAAFHAFSTSLRRSRARRQTGDSAARPASVSPTAGLVQGVIGSGARAPSASVVFRRSTRHAVPAPRAIDPSTAAPGPVPCAAATAAGAPVGGLTADQIASDYGLSSYHAAGDEGQGVTIALYELEPFSAADVAAYQACYSTNAAVTTVPVDGGVGSGPGSGEAAMDVEDVIGLAPQASIRVYEGPATGTGAYDTYSRIVADDSAQVISTSWGLCEALQGATPAAAESTLFQEAAVQGQTVVAATGDQGSDDCGDGQRSVDDPAGQPWVTAVGATSRRGTQDVVWDGAQGATGGGASAFWGRPAYQDRAAVPQSSVRCGASGHSCREVPDVAVDGDPATGYVVDYEGAWRTVGGSSVSAPTVAALAALLDASPACGGQRIGFLNPALYAAAGDSGSFGDITSGGNGFDSVPGFAAGPGYDMASGLGTPGPSLGQSLCPVGPVTLRTPRAQTAVAGRFQSLQLSASAPSGAALRYSAAGLPAGLRLDRASGRFSGAPRISGRWTVKVTAANGARGAATASFVWSVQPSRSPASRRGLRRSRRPGAAAAGRTHR